MRTSRLLLLLLPLLWVAVLASAAWVVFVRNEARSLFAELERLSTQRDELNIEWGQLQLEQSAWSNHGFVERVASEKLHMTLPAPVDVKIVAP
jgi:cell division protein FtsL